MDENREKTTGVIVPVQPQFTAKEKPGTKQIIATIETLPDDALGEISGAIRKQMAERKTQRRKQALSEIRRLAKENGLDVSVNPKARKRGRPPKEDGPA